MKKKGRYFRFLTGMALVLLLALFALRAFVCDVYPVVHDSMRPTLHSGDKCLVVFGSDDLERWDLVVASDLGGTPFVKRVVAVPFERLLIEQGDLLIGGAQLPREAPRPPLIPVYDSAYQTIEEHFNHGSTRLDPWLPGPDAWELDATEVGLGEDAGMLRLMRGVHDDYIDDTGAIVHGKQVVGDLVIECEVQVLQPGGRLRFEVTEELDTFQLAVEIEGWPVARATLSRIVSGHPDEVLSEAQITLPREGWIPIRLVNVDDHLTGVVGDAELIADYPGNILRGSAPVGGRVKLGGEGCRARFQNIRVLRDLHWTMTGEYAVGRVYQLRADEFFLLGDNSAGSRDSRAFGPVSRDRILGRAVRVVWPTSRARSLGAR